MPPAAMAPLVTAPAVVAEYEEVVPTPSASALALASELIVSALAAVRTDLEGLRVEGAVEQLDAVECGLTGDGIDLLHQRVDFLLQGGAVGGGVGGVGGLYRQFAHPLQRVGDALQAAFSGLRQRNAVVGVARSLVEAGDL
jgi:hypothetical protein